jgi:uncharacterized protein (DUF58 family)
VIYPTRRAIILAAAGAGPALIAAVAAPSLWPAAGGWVALILGLTFVDALTGPGTDDVEVDLDTPASLGVAAEGRATIRTVFDRVAPAAVQLVVETNARLAATPDRLIVPARPGEASVTLTPIRRGEGEVAAIWLRWTGPFGLVWKQIRSPLGRVIAVTTNIEAVKAQAVRLFSREHLSGLKAQLETGEGADFHALRELVGPSDLRGVDWKQSARHGKLLGKEFRAERNHPIVFAIDSGRQMCEPLAGAPRLDLALNAALLLAFVSLKLGDLAGVFAFDARPRLFTGVLGGPRAFERLRRLTAGIDYSSEETNYTFGLTQLGAALRRRSLVVVFTDFADSTSAQLMIENLGRLARRNLILFVVFRDEELEAMAVRRPDSPEAVTRAVTAAGLLKARGIVIERLRRLGAHIVDAPAANLGPTLISSYLDLKRRELL